jgi:hypothetical protein
MELLLELILQIFGEFFLDILIHLFPKSSRDLSVYLGIVVYALIGAIAGGVTLLVLPAHLIRSQELRIANLVITPLLVAALMAWIGAIRRSREKRIVQMEEFVYAYATALTFAVVRFFWAK